MRSIKFNAIMNTLLMASNMIVSIITVPYITRILSVEGYGNVNFAQSISSWLSSLCLVGIGTYGIRECARVRNDAAALASTVRELLTIVTICTGIVLGLFSLSIPFVPQFSNLGPLMWMFLVSTLLLSYGVEWFFQALEQYDYITARSMIFKALSLVLTFCLIRNEGDWVLYGAILAFVTCGNNVFNLARLIRTVNWKLAGPINLHRHLKPLAAFAAQSIASSIYLNMDTVVLGMVSTSYEVGLYQLAVKLKTVMWSVLNAVLSVLIPRLSNYAAIGNDREFKNLLEKGSVMTLDICVALSGYLMTFSLPVAVFISGETFAPAAPSICTIGLVNLFSCLSYLIGLCVLAPLGRERQLALGNLIGVPISLLLNLILDQHFGALGAATAMLCAELAIFTVQLYFARDYAFILFEPKNTFSVLASNSLAAVASFVLLSLLPLNNVLVVIPVSLVTYFGVLATGLLLTKEKGGLIALGIIVSPFRRKNQQ